MELSLDAIKSWDAMKELTRGLEGYHKQTRIIKMKKLNGEMAKINEENADIFFQHFVKSSIMAIFLATNRYLLS